MQTNTELWIDAIEFQDKGGWKEDTQFVHLMGCGYLMAAYKPGIPVEDAHTTVQIPAAGTYRIWVRDRNWLRSHSPGTFCLLVNGEHNGTILGKQPSDAWVWEIAGDFKLEAGPCQLSMHDLTGYFGRFSSVLITDDLDYVPPRDMNRMHKDRARIKGLNTEVSFGGNYEVIVAGGGPGGVPAAIACARQGIKTLLLQNRSMLGGNGSTEVGITFDGAEVAHPRAREGGIAEEIRRLRDRDPENHGDWMRAMEQLTAAEPNLTVLCDSHVCDAKTENDTIREITVLNTKTLLKTTYTAKIFIDCTGDGWLGYFAGAKYRFGREASWQHNEDIAPDIADTLTMSGCIRSRHLPDFIDAEEDVGYHAPEWVPKLPEDEKEFGRVIHEPRMYWWLEAPNTYDDMWDGEEARDALLLVILGFYDHLKNHWSGRHNYTKKQMVLSTIINGRRESIRLIGDYILTQDDCTSGRVFEDAISYSGWALDIHHPQGIYSGKEGPLYCARHVKLPTIPYRCLYSKNISNLLFAGRNVSVTHVSLGTVRVQNTIATLGQAAGTAAAMCIELGETPRGIYQRHIKELQQLLIKNDQYIPGYKNEDAGDPCLTASVTASSVSTTEIFMPKQGAVGPLVPLNEARATICAFNSKRGDIHGIYVKLHSALSEPRTIRLHVQTLGDLDTVNKFDDVYTAEAVVPPMAESWVFFPVEIQIDTAKFLDGSYLMLWLEPEAGLSWRSIEKLSNYRKVGVRDEAGNWKWTVGSYLYFSLKLPKDITANCAPETVINGHSRILSETDYEWVSDPEQPMPQWLELQLAQPTEINQISLVFDTDMSNPGTCAHAKYPAVSTCVRDYTVEVFDGSAWTNVADICGNFMRKCTHRFAALVAEKIRVTVTATNGDPSARITEVRASLEQ